MFRLPDTLKNKEIHLSGIVSAAHIAPCGCFHFGPDCPTWLFMYVAKNPILAFVIFFLQLWSDNLCHMSWSILISVVFYIF